jgi:hypothetical protein
VAFALEPMLGLTTGGRASIANCQVRFKWDWVLVADPHCQPSMITHHSAAPTNCRTQVLLRAPGVIEPGRSQGLSPTGGMMVVDNQHEGHQISGKTMKSS